MVTHALTDIDDAKATTTRRRTNAFSVRGDMGSSEGGMMSLRIGEHCRAMISFYTLHILMSTILIDLVEFLLLSDDRNSGRTCKNAFA